MAFPILMSLEERLASYKAITGFPLSLFIGEDERIAGIWIMGQNYTVKSEYYGGYPHGYLRRVMALFPDKSKTLHLFSGKVDLETCPGDTVDVNADLNPTWVDDAQTLKNVPLEDYDLVLADPPYSVEDAERYQTGMVKRNLVMDALKRLQVGAHVIWLDQAFPIYSADFFKVIAIIGMVRSTNHRFRCVIVYERRDGRGT